MVDGVAVVIGCGPVSLPVQCSPLDAFPASHLPYPCTPNPQVGLCTITSALTLFSTVLAVDPNPTRRALAQKHGAQAFAPDDILKAVQDATDGRGADAVLEVVGYQNALELAMQLVRRWGAISSVGVHNGTRSFDGEALFTKK